MGIAFVPARCGSKSIKLKNVKLLCGKPLIYWSLKAIENAKTIDKAIVATDCSEIAEIVQSFGFSKVEIYFRDPANAKDTSSTESVMLEYLNQSDYPEEEFIVLVQVTSPMTQSQDFDNAFEILNKNKADSLLTCARMKRFFWNKNGISLNYDHNNRPRRQDFEGSLVENGAFYINTVKNIQIAKNRLYGQIVVYEMPEYTSMELDEPDDWFVVEMLMRKHVLKLEKRTIKLFLMDVDGVLTDAGMYYSDKGDELKKFNTHDGKGIELLRNAGIKTGIITSENTCIVEKRAKKLKIDYLYQGVKDKINVAKEICEQESISLDEVAYIGDDINDIELLSNVGIAACPANSLPNVKSIPNIINLSNSGGEGAVREFVEMLIHV